MHQAKGFTLIELIIAVAILGILMAMAVPALGDFLVNSRIRGVASEMRDGLQMARMEAIKRNNTVNFVVSGGGWEIQDSSATVLRSRVATSKEAALAYTYTDTSGTSSTLSSSNKRTFSFAGDGRMADVAAAGTVSIKQTGTNQCQKDGGSFACLNIVVSAGGISRTCNPAASSSDPTAC